MSADARPRWLSLNAAALLVLVLLAGGLLLWQQPWQSDESSAPKSPKLDAGAALTAQFSELSAATTDREFVDAWGSGDASRKRGLDAWQARDSLDVQDVTLRYVSGGDSPAFDNGDTRARVQVTWAGAGGESATVLFRMRPRDDGFDIVGTDRGKGALPIWLAGSVENYLGGRDLVVSVDLPGTPRQGPVDYVELVDTARQQVDDLLPVDVGTVTVVRTGSSRIAGAVLDQPASAVRQIAAVSTRFDERQGQLAGPVVVLNPEVFGDLDARARQIVMTHEATHVLTGAVGSRADTWVVEGFADFVALREDKEPLATSAGQILRQVKAGGAPKTLPSATDFDEQAHGLGASYESAWLVFRSMQDQYSDAQIIDFYEAVVDGMSAADAAQRVLGTTIGEITERWRSYLTKSASTVS